MLHQTTDVFCKVEEQLYLGSYESICHLQDQESDTFTSLEVTAIPSEPLEVNSVDGKPIEQEVIALWPLSLKGAAVLTIERRQLPKDITQFFGAYKFIDLDDGLNSELIPHFDTTYDFIKENKASGRNVLIHWYALYKYFSEVRTKNQVELLMTFYREMHSAFS